MLTSAFNVKGHFFHTNIWFEINFEAIFTWQNKLIVNKY